MVIAMLETCVDGRWFYAAVKYREFELGIITWRAGEKSLRGNGG